MPTYEYLCQACSHRFDTWQKMTADPLQICPECGGHIRRVYYPAGIVFKGSGFYKTDHRAVAAGADGNGHHSTKNDDNINHTDGINGTNSTNGADNAASSETKSSGDSKSAATESHNSKGTAPSENKVTASTK